MLRMFFVLIYEPTYCYGASITYISHYVYSTITCSQSLRSSIACITSWKLLELPTILLRLCLWNCQGFLSGYAFYNIAIRHKNFCLFYSHYMFIYFVIVHLPYV